MSDFRKLADNFHASPQITVADVESAKAQGIALIIDNRPDGEDPTAPQSDEIAAAAEAAGIAFCAIPVGHSGFSETQVDQTIAALSSARGPVLAYCRSGTRSTLLWSLAQAKGGANPDDLARTAMSAGYDLTPVRPMLDMLAAR